MHNLEGTKDSYSDSEDVNKNFKRPNRESVGTNQSLIEQMYNSCKKLLFKVDLVIKNAKGEKIIEKRLSKITEIFNDPSNSEMIE